MRIDLYWTADFHPERRFRVRYMPVFEGVSDAASDSASDNVAYDGFPPEIAGDLEVLKQLSITYADPDMPEVEGGTWAVEVHQLERWPAGWGSRQPEYFLAFDFFLVHPLPLRERRPLRWSEEELPDELKGLARRIDEFAKEKAQAAWSERYNEYADREELETHVPPPAKVFLNYRAGRESVESLVQTIHDMLSEAPGRSFFQVFLDRPDLRSGEWRPQLQEAIEGADAFLAVLSDGYYDGVNAVWELEKALEHRERHGSPEIVPILLEGSWRDHECLADFQGVRLPLDSDEGLLRDQVGRIRSLIVDQLALGYDAESAMHD